MSAHQNCTAAPGSGAGIRQDELEGMVIAALQSRLMDQPGPAGRILRRVYAPPEQAAQ
jgi:hypothetical protein